MDNPLFADISNTSSWWGLWLYNTLHTSSVDEITFTTSGTMEQHKFYKRE